MKVSTQIDPHILQTHTYYRPLHITDIAHHWYTVMQVWTPAISETRALWEQLFTDITQFDDYRTLKATKGGGGPEFTHKTTKKGLW